MCSRENGIEAIVIDHGTITVTVVEIRGDKVRLGIDAPQNVTVHRQEIEDEIQRENQAATIKALESIDLTAPE